MKKNYDKILQLTLSSEGRYSNNPKDRGGATNYGISQRSLSVFLGRAATVQDVRELTLKEARQIYHSKYWMPIKGNLLPSGIDAVVFDYAVNSGVKRSIKLLQELVGTKQDGVIGSKTLAAIRSKKGIPGIVAGFQRSRLAFLKSLASYKIFGHGWKRRVKRVTNLAYLLTNKVPRPAPPSLWETLVSIFVSLVSLVIGILKGRKK